MRIGLYDLIRLNFAIYPGIRNYRAASFLRGYYDGRRERSGPARYLFNLLFYAGFQLWLPRRARKVARKWGLDTAWQRRAVAICRARFADPSDIALFRITDAAELDHYMRRFEHIGVGRAIAHPRTDHSPLILDKRRFYALCREGGIPHPRVFAEHDRGVTLIHAVPETGQALFVKPATGSGGRGAGTARFDGGGDPEVTLERLGKAAGRSWVVQERLHPHPALADIAFDALPTVRVITLLDERGRPEIVSTVLRLAAGPGLVVDNIGMGGLSAPVDPATGVLGAACGGMRPGEYDRHPASGAAIRGREIPQWSAVRALALSTHAQHFHDHVMIGWDIALAGTGPCMLEANARPSIIMTQRAARTPVGRMRMGELIRHHLEQRRREGSTGRRLLAG